MSQISISCYNVIMKLLYAANIRLPTEKAHGVQIMKMCEAFAKCGVDVELLVPRRKNHIDTDPFDYYAVERNFCITYVPSGYSARFGRFGFWLETLLFSEKVARYVAQSKPDIVYSRDEFILINLCLSAVKCVWETHTGVWNVLLRLFIGRFFKIIAISTGLADLYRNEGVNHDKIQVFHDGADLMQFSVTVNREDQKRKLGIPLEKKIVLYVGHLYKWKGVDTLLDASKLFSSLAQTVIIGGTKEEVSILANKYPNVLFLGYRPYSELAFNQKIADILVVPNSGEDKISRLYTSPLKVFAHMTSGIPIIASDLPSLREILTERNSILIPPDDPVVLADFVRRILVGDILTKLMALQAQIDVRQYDWRIRAQAIIRFLGN